jgi:outer membrane biosynthesis protein TonB
VSDPENFDFTPEDHISGEIGERVRGILSAAESAAAVIRHEAEQEIQSRKRLAEAERGRYLEVARQEADALLARRIAKMNELSDALIEGAERLLGQMEGGHELRRQLDRTVASLAEAAARLAEESHTPVVEPAATVTPEPEPEPEPEQAVRQPEPEAEPAIQDVEVAEPEAEPEPEPQRLAEAPEPQPDPLAEAPEPQPDALADETDRRLRPAPEPEEATANGARSAVDADAEADDVLAARLVALQMAVAGSPRGEVEEHLRSAFAVEDTTSILNDVFGTDAPRFR